jgi:putative lipoic acid-binding regulatory protein
MAAEEAPSLIEYPSLFPIKVMGVNDPALEQAIIDIALRFDPDYDRATLQLRPSRSGNYIGLTLSITATSREQLDALYSALSSHPMVKVVL